MCRVNKSQFFLFGHKNMLKELVRITLVRLFKWVPQHIFKEKIINKYNLLTLILLNNLISHSQSDYQPIRLHHIMFLFKFTNWMTNSVDPDQIASSEAIWSGSTLFAKVGVAMNSRIWVKHPNLNFFILFKWACLQYSVPEFLNQA